MRTYHCFYRGKKIVVVASSSLSAQGIAATVFKARKHYDITVVLADRQIDPASL